MRPGTRHGDDGMKIASNLGRLENAPVPLKVSFSRVSSLLRTLLVLTSCPVTAIVAPGGWATAKRPFSDCVAALVLPRKRYLSLPRFRFVQPPSARAAEAIKGKSC